MFLRRFCLIIFYVIGVYAIFEDQAGVLDWTQRYFGKAQFVKYDYNGVLAKSYFIGSTLNVIGAIHLKDGAIIWRQVLEENAHLLSMELCDQKLISVSVNIGTVLRAWDAKSGFLVWERFLSDLPVANSNLLCSASKRLVVVYGKQIALLNLANGYQLWSNNILQGYQNNTDKMLEGSYVVPLTSDPSADNISLAVALLHSQQCQRAHEFEIYNLIIPNHNERSASISFIRKYSTLPGLNVSQCGYLNSNVNSITSLVCLSSGNGNSIPQLNVLVFSNDLNKNAPEQWETVRISQTSPHLVMLTDNYLLLTSSTSANPGAVYHIDPSGHISLKYYVDHAMFGYLGQLNDRNYLFTIFHNSAESFNNVILNVYELENGQIIKGMSSRRFTLSNHHGSVESFSAVVFFDASSMPNFRLVLHTEDHAIQVLRQYGERLWIREESLASIVAVEFVDLPVSESQAKMEEEFGHATSNIIHMFVRRLKTQISQVMVWLKHWTIRLPHMFVSILSSPSITNLIFSSSESLRKEHIVHSSNGLSSSVKHSPSGMPPRLLIDEDLDIQSLQNHSMGLNSAEKLRTRLEEFLIRDNFNLHKMLVVATSVGKLFGLETERGRVVWEHLVPSADLLADKRFHLFQQRNTAHFPLPPIMTLLLRSKDSHYPMLYSFNPITGVPVHETDEDIYHLNTDVLQVMLHPGPIHSSSNYIRPVLLLTADLEVHIYPPKYRNLLGPIDSAPLYIYTIEREKADLIGYRILRYVSNTDPNVSVQNLTYRAERIWNMRLSSSSVDELPDHPHHVIAAAAAKSLSEHVYSVGRVLGDRSVLYKYLNPNLIAVLTVGGHVVNQTNSINLYLIDVVVGRVLYSATHKRCTEPISLIHSENWIVYTYYNHKSLRNELTVLELYEPTTLASGKLCAAYSFPGPWQLFLRNIFPSNWVFGLSLLGGTAQTDNSATSSLPYSESMFSSLYRASDMDGFCVSTGANSLMPQILQQSYILSTAPRRGAAAVSSTERGITTKSVIFGLQKNGLIELPKTFLDPRRNLDMTAELLEEGVHPYAPVLPLSDLSMISYNQSLMRIQSIRTASTGLESTSLVFAYGLDLFFTRIAPSMTYDLLKEDFDYTAIATVTFGMIIASMVTQRLAARRTVFRTWS